MAQLYCVAVHRIPAEVRLSMWESKSDASKKFIFVHHLFLPCENLDKHSSVLAKAAIEILGTQSIIAFVVVHAFGPFAS